MENIVWHDGKVSDSDRSAKLGQKGIVLWFTGLSGSGKSTIAVELEKHLINKGKFVYRLDGDNVRHGLNADLGFSEDDRTENIRRITEVAALFKDANIITLVSFITPFEKMRKLAKDRIGEGFYEIYVKADVETCAKRDPKGLYEKAKKGEISNFTGITSPYEEPKNPDIILDTNNEAIEACVEKILKVIER